MKSITFALLLALASVCSAAIEFSEDVAVEATVAAEATEAKRPAKPKPTETGPGLPVLLTAGLPATSRPVDPAVMASNAAVATAQASGGVRIGMTNSVAMLAMMSGGGGSRGNRAPESSDNLLVEVDVEAEAPAATEQNGNEVETTGGVTVEALPEPATLGVWAILTLCGIAFMRRRSS